MARNRSRHPFTPSGPCCSSGWASANYEPSRAARWAPGAVPAPFRAFAGTFGLTLLNPATILSFIAIFAAASLATPSPRVAVQIVAGVFVGSAFWWLILASVTARVRRVAGPAVLRRINIASGFCLIAFALSAFFAR